MLPAQLPMLPRDVIDGMASATLAAEGHDAHAWARLSLVSRAWRQHLRGASIGWTAK